MRGTGKWKIFWRTWRAAGAPSIPLRAARPMSPSGRCCRKTSATGVPRWNSCWDRSVAAKGSRRFPRWISPGPRSATSTAICREGVGTLLAKLATGLPIQFSTPVKSIDWGGRWIEVQIPRGDLRARAVIITASTGVLAAGKIRFDPELSKRHHEAIGKLALGSYDHVAIEFAGNPLGLESDDLVFEKAMSQRTAALLANLSGSKLCFVVVAGGLGAGLAAQGEAAMVAFALDWLASLYGSEVKQAVRRTHATRWNNEPGALGAASVAAPGGQWARKALSEPLRERLWFAGEAVHETLWGTVGGAWEAGERAAEAVLKRIARG